MDCSVKKIFTEIKWRLVGFFGKILIDILCLTTRIDTVGLEEVKYLEEDRRAIGAFWHSRLLLVSYLFKNWGAATLVSGSGDGEYVARIIKRQGHLPIRGSTTRGGRRALARLIQELKGGRPGVVIPDGPQGPRYKVQPGVMLLAKKAGLPIVPITYSAKNIKIFNSWDRFILPMPFTACRVIYGNPIWVPADADRATEEKCRLQLEADMCRITREADRHFGHVID
jgi:lysophospholipid acyltransferase (LPLAT)-like uncharacterized protein